MKLSRLKIIATLALLLLPVMAEAGACGPLPNGEAVSFHRQLEYHFDGAEQLDGLSLRCWIDNPSGEPLWILERYDPLATESVLPYLIAQGGIDSRLICWNEPLNGLLPRDRLPQAVLNCSVAGVEGYLRQPAFDYHEISNPALLFTRGGLPYPNFAIDDYSGMILREEVGQGLVLWLGENETVYLLSEPHRSDDLFTLHDTLAYVNQHLNSAGLGGLDEVRVLPVEYEGWKGYLCKSATATGVVLFCEGRLLITIRLASQEDNSLASLIPWVRLQFQEF